jgi:hypothetical protein
VSDDLPQIEKPDKETREASEARAVEAAAIRRRWITLGEMLAVIAVVISALTLWNNWSERSDTAATKAQDDKRASARAATLVLMVASSKDGELILRLASTEQSVQSQKLMFPTALALDPAETTGEPRIEVKWFERALKRVRNQARLPDNSRGDERLPVVILTRFLVDGEPHEDVALYDIGYSISGRWLGGHSVTLRGLSLVSRVKGDAAQKKLDARWKRILPQP